LALPVFVDGNVLTAAQVNSWLEPVAAVKTSDESVTSSTALQNDNELVVAVAANATYHLTAYLDYEGGTLGASDLKFGWTFPAGLTMSYVASRISNITGNPAGGGGVVIQTGVPISGSSGAGNSQSVSMDGTVVVSSTAGSLQLQWAQNTSSGTATIVHAKSYISLQRFA